MTAPQIAPFKESVRSMLRDRVLDAATVMMVQRGWGGVRMGQLATTVGVSRQTVYNEFGSKPSLGHSLVLRELERVLVEVERAVAGVDNVEDALRESVRACLHHIRSSPLAGAILAGIGQGTSELLPLLTTHSRFLVDAAVTVLDEGLVRRGLRPEVGNPGLRNITEMASRLTLSYLLASPPDIDEVADNITAALAPALRELP